jgi:hypothetical protein
MLDECMKNDNFSLKNNNWVFHDEYMKYDEDEDDDFFKKLRFQ